MKVYPDKIKKELASGGVFTPSEANFLFIFSLSQAPASTGSFSSSGADSLPKPLMFWYY